MHRYLRGAPRRIRTFDLPVRSRALYPLSYGRNLERVMGIEPTRPAWKAGILPLNYTHILFFNRHYIISHQIEFVNSFSKSF